jgi:hypothetical protein
MLASSWIRNSIMPFLAETRRHGDTRTRAALGGTRGGGGGGGGGGGCYESHGTVTCGGRLVGTSAVQERGRGAK